MDNCRTVTISYSTIRDYPRHYQVEIQRGSVMQDPENRHRHTYDHRIEKAYGIKQPITDVRRERFAQLFDGWNGGVRPENVEVEFYLGVTKMSITFGVDGRLNKE